MMLWYLPERRMPMRRIPFLLLVCVVAALGVAGCGGDDNSSSDTSATTTETTDTTTTDEGTTGASGGGGGVIKVEADPGGDLAFVQKSLTAKPGKNTIEFTNESSVPHDVKIEEGGKEIGGTEVVSGGKAEASVQLDAGEPYTFFCSVPGHRQAGMEGKLTVK
jgi:plastocyanin